MLSFFHNLDCGNSEGMNLGDDGVIRKRKELAYVG